MDSLKLNEDICRICLKEDVKLSWNDEVFEFCGISYKYCYFKYTKLEECDSDCFPTSLCEMCANELKNAHLLFEKALESYNILHVVFKTKQLEAKYSNMDICNSLPLMKCESQVFDEANSPIDDKTMIDIEEERCVSPVCDAEKIAENEIAAKDSEQILSDYVEPSHFVDMKTFESSIETPLEQRISEFPDTDTKKSRNKRKNYIQISDKPLKKKLSESSGKKLLKLSTLKNASRKKVCKTLVKISLEEQHNDSSTTEILKSSTTEKDGNIKVSLPQVSSLKEHDERSNTEPTILAITEKGGKKKGGRRYLCKTLISSEQQHKNKCGTEILKLLTIEESGDRKVCESLSKISSEQQHIEGCSAEIPKLSTSGKTGNMKVCELSPEISSLQKYKNECFNTEIPKPSTSEKTNSIKVSESLPEISLSLKEHNNECSNIETPKSSATKDTISPLEQALSESCEAKSVVSAKYKKSREKYLLMCQYCSLKVEGARKLEKHEATHNENRQRTETCPKCGVKLYTKLTLTEHMKIHDENRQKKHKCEFCGNAFFNRGSLNVHRRIHLGLMVKCQICSKEFFRQVDLDKHLLKHSVSPLQRNIGKKKYAVQCQYCNKSIVTVKYKEHIAAHLDQPQMKCKICDKKFFSRPNCTNHLRRLHLKNSSEYEDCIHYYVDRKSRVSILMMKQQLSAQPLAE